MVGGGRPSANETKDSLSLGDRVGRLAGGVCRLRRRYGGRDPSPTDADLYACPHSDGYTDRDQYSDFNLNSYEHTDRDKYYNSHRDYYRNCITNCDANIASHSNFHEHTWCHADGNFRRCSVRALGI